MVLQNDTARDYKRQPSTALANNKCRLERNKIQTNKIEEMNAQDYSKIRKEISFTIRSCKRLQQKD